MPPTPGIIGLVAHPNDIPAWSAATDIRPDAPMIFEHADNQRPLTEWLGIAKRSGYKAVIITWEWWTPTPVGSTNADSATIQPAWSNESIISGAHDEYIYAFTRAIRDAGMTTYIRLNHEMNGAPDGPWYPWSNDAASYVAAWKHIVSRARRIPNATNLRWVWSPNSNMFLGAPEFLTGALPYWPGANWVDVVGVTGIQFGPPRTWMGTDLGYRLDLMRRIFGKPIAVSELNSEYTIRNDYFRSLAAWQRHGGGLEYIALSQHASRGAANGVTAGSMDWTIATDTVGRNAFGDLVDAMRRPKS